MESLFWLSSLLIAYIYVGYPLILKLLPRLPNDTYTPFEELPRVTVLIPAFNEERYICDTIANKLASNYPEEKLQIIVISDESDDRTDELVKELSTADHRIKLIRQSPRQGKTAGLNLAIPHAEGEIIIFSDANSHYHPDAIRNLVTMFERPDIGYVTGKMVYVNGDGSLVGDGCSAYMKYENYLRELETETGSVVGVDGGVDAIRKELYQPMSPDQLPDFVLPLKVVTQGKRVAYCANALLNEETLNSAQSEFRMRVRVSLRAYWAMWDMKHLFNPFKYHWFSLQIASHKLLRYLAFIPLFIALVTNGLITGEHIFYKLTFILQVGFYSAAAFVALNDGSKNRILGLAHYFCLINLASAMAFIKFIKREKIVMWKPRVGQ